MEVKLFINKTAKNKIKQLFKSTVELEEDDINIINGWLEEERVKCYILCDKDDNIKTIALLHKCDYDPLKTHSNPYVLNYIYTFSEYRRNNFAYKMLLHIK